MEKSENKEENSADALSGASAVLKKNASLSARHTIDASDAVFKIDLSNDDAYKIDPKRHQMDTARRIAYALLAIMAATLLLHYAGAFYLILNSKTDVLEHWEKLFNVWLPVMSGLVGSAVTFYFTKESK